MQKAFDKMRLLMAANALAAYLVNNNRFNVYTDAFDFQLGACIIQKGMPLVYFLHKLTKSQKDYTTMEKEMLSIVETLEEFWGILLGVDIYIFTDHEYLMFNTLKTHCVLRWCARVDEFSPILHYIEGPRNILANNLSRLHHLGILAQIVEGK